MIYEACSGGCVAAAILMHYALRPARALVRPGRRPEPASSPNVALVLRMLAVAVQQGASLPSALAVIGETMDGEFAASLRAVARMLRHGAVWRDAWIPAVRSDVWGGAMALLRDALEDSWNRGVSPLERIDGVVEQIQLRRRISVERGAAHLSVRLLIPTGLCVLPAFILIGVIPSIGSFAW